MNPNKVTSLSMQILSFLRSYNPTENLTLTDVARRFGARRIDIVRLANKYNVKLNFVVQKVMSFDIQEAPNLEKTENKVKETPPTAKQDKNIPPIEEIPKRTGRKPKKFTPQEEQFLLANAHRSWASLSREMGVTLYRVRKFLIAKGVTPHKQGGGLSKLRIPKDVQDYLLKNRHKTYVALTRETGYPYHVIRTFFVEKGIKRIRSTKPKSYVRLKSSSFPEDVKASLRANASRPWTQLSEESGYSFYLIRKFFKSEGIKPNGRGRPPKR